MTAARKKEIEAKEPAKKAPAQQKSKELPPNTEALLAEVRDLRKKVKDIDTMQQANDALKEKLQNVTEENRSLRGDVHEMHSQCNRMKNVLMLGNSSTLSLLIDEFVGFTNPMVKQIVLESHLVEFDKEERKKIQEIITYFTDTAMSFQQMLELPTFTLDSSASKKQLKRLGSSVTKSIKGINTKVETLDMMQVKLLCTQLSEIQQFLSSFLNSEVK